MDPEKNIDEVVDTFDGGDEVSVDDFIKQLEEKEKDLHITVDTSIIEIAESFDDGNLPDFLKDALDEAEAAASKAPVAPAVPNADKTTIKRLEVDVKNLQQTIAKMEADRDEMFKNSQRRSKDFEAFKSRAERERKETFQNQIGNVATLMLPALDNLHRALESAEHLPGEKSDAFQLFYEGIALVSEQINDILCKMGIKPIPTVGEDFDPHYHEAVGTDDSGEYPQNTITGEILRGYIAGERVIRHSMVKVAMGAARPVEDMFSTPETSEPAGSPTPTDMPNSDLP
jgi:molecular chaperone GrpE